MIYTAVLIAHIFIACATLITLAYSGFAIFKHHTGLYTQLMVAIGVLAALETVSGFELAILSPTVTIAYVASHLVWYLGLCLAVEAALLVQTRRVWIG